jgi:hypothetical protein
MATFHVERVQVSEVRTGDQWWDGAEFVQVHDPARLTWPRRSHPVALRLATSAEEHYAAQLELARLQEENRKLSQVLGELVRLKDGGKRDAPYRTEKDAAWEEAREVLAGARTAGRG